MGLTGAGGIVRKAILIVRARIRDGDRCRDYLQITTELSVAAVRRPMSVMAERQG